jgi:hypothetical protein
MNSKSRTPRQPRARGSKSQFTVSTKRGEARTEKTGVCKGEAFGINKAARRLKRQAV